MYKRSILGRKYIRLITSSPRLFITFVLFGVVLFLFLTLTTRIDVIKTYSAEVFSVESEIALSIKASDIPVGSAYIYSNKNEAVFSVFIENVESIKDNVILHFSNDERDIIQFLSTQNIYIDIPQGKETLLYRIFVKGGKGRE